MLVDAEHGKEHGGNMHVTFKATERTIPKAGSFSLISLMSIIISWFATLITEFKRVQVEVDPTIDFPRDF